MTMLLFALIEEDLLLLVLHTARSLTLTLTLT